MNQKTKVVSNSALLRTLTMIDLAERRVHEYFKDAPHRIYYRGVEDYEYRLVPGLLREMKDATGSVVADTLLKYELEIVESVEREYPVALRGLTFIEKLAWMQHYGFPTRLLDVTRNKLVALYFATSGVRAEKMGMVYVIGIPEDQIVPVGRMKKIKGFGRSVPKLLRASAITERQRRQQGEFLLMGNRHYAWIDEAKGTSCRIDHVSPGGIVAEGKGVLAEGKSEIRDALACEFGITRHFLFPEDPSDYRDELIAEIARRCS